MNTITKTTTKTIKTRFSKSIATLSFNLFPNQQVNAFKHIKKIENKLQSLLMQNQSERINVVILEFNVQQNAATNQQKLKGDFQQQFIDEELAKTYSQQFEESVQLSTILNTIDQLHIPIIAKVNGMVRGAYLGLLCCCDIIFASKLSKFRLDGQYTGIHQPAILPFISASIGNTHTRRYALSAEVISARRARRLGLIDEALVLEELDENVMEVARAIAKHDAASISAYKSLLDGKRINEPNRNNESINQLAATAASLGQDNASRVRLAKLAKPLI